MKPSLLAWKGMRNGRPTMSKRKTHFEQIPVEEVRRIAWEVVELPEKTAAPNVVVETPATKTEPYSLQLTDLCRSRG
jgi:hypothetical protein